MNVHELIQTRRSVRKYKSEPVDADSLQKVIQAIQWAPSWVNLQPWEIVVVDDQEVKERLMECIAETNPGRKAVGQAPYVLAVCGRAGESGHYQGKPSTVHGDWVMFDLGIACQNACLAAWDLGLGTLHLGLMDHRKAAGVLGLPEGVDLYELIPLGVPERVSKPPPRKETETFTHGNRFGSPFRL